MLILYAKNKNSNNVKMNYIYIDVFVNYCYNYYCNLYFIWR